MFDQYFCTFFRIAVPEASPSISTVKRYNRTRLVLGIATPVLSVAVLLVLVFTGATVQLRDWASSIASDQYLSLLLFVATIGVITGAVTAPLRFYAGYVVEHQFNLSNQRLARWAWEHVKGMMIGAPLMMIMVVVLYFCMTLYGEQWWLPVGITLAFVSVVLARFIPVFILPLFYRFTPLANGSLKDRITELSHRAGVEVEGIFAFDMSKNTKKANAGFTGIGKAKRIILADTLLQKFSEEEIETVFAHELGHYAHRHLVIGMVAGIVSTFVGLFVVAKLHAISVGWLELDGITDMASLPILGVWLSVYGFVTSPLGNLLSRKHEREADSYAVRTTGKREAFISALRKLSENNMADPQPHPVVEFLLYSHPSIERRIALIESLGGR